MVDINDSCILTDVIHTGMYTQLYWYSLNNGNANLNYVAFSLEDPYIYLFCLCSTWRAWRRLKFYWFRCVCYHLYIAFSHILLLCLTKKWNKTYLMPTNKQQSMWIPRYILLLISQAYLQLTGLITLKCRWKALEQF